MDSDTHFSYRCPACSGRSRVASRHAGQMVVCPHCQAHGAARPDVRPAAVPSLTPTGPATTKRYARPLEPQTGVTVRRMRQVDGRFTDELPNPRPPAPGMDGFADGRPGTSTVHRGVQVVALPPSPRPTPYTPNRGPLIGAWTVAAAAALIAVWAVTTASASQSRTAEYSAGRAKAEDSLAAAQVRADSAERRAAQLQTELAAEKASTLRERELVADLNRTIEQLGGELARALRTSPATAATGIGPFPAPPGPLTAPLTRRETPSR